MKFFIIFFLFFSYSFTALSKCEKKDVILKANIVNDNLILQISNLENLLTGKTVKDYTIQSIFGSDFSVDKTPKRISELDDLIKKNNGIAVENRTLEQCLITLKLNSLNLQLKSNSKQLLNLKIKLLKKNLSLDDSIRESGITDNLLPTIKEEIGKDSKEALIARTSLEDSLIDKQTNSKNIITNSNRELIEFESDLTKIKIELLNQKILFNTNLEKKIKYFEISSIKLKALSASIDKLSNEELTSKYQEVETLWLSLTSENYYDILSSTNSLELPLVPELPILKSENKNQYETVKIAHKEIILLKTEIIKNYSIKKNQELKLLNQLVTNSNAIRENFFRRLGSLYVIKNLFSFNFYKLLKNEIISSPFRMLSYFYSKFLYVREQLSIGQEGITNLIFKVIQLSLAFMCLFFLKSFFSKVNRWVDKFFSYLFKHKKRSYLLKSIFSAWSKIKENLPIFLWLFCIFLFKELKEADEFYLVLKAAEVYLGSLILKSFVTIFLGSVSRIDSSNFIAFKNKAQKTSNKFKNIYQFYFFTLILFEATVGKVYSYTLISYVVVIYSLYLLLTETDKWEKEFTVYTEKKFSGAVVEKFFYLLQFAPKFLRSTFVFVFIVVFMIFNLFVSLTENFEISKKISANLFKKQIEKVEAEDGADDKIPTEYKDYFSLKSLETEEEYVENENGIQEKIVSEIDDWVNKRSDEHSLVVYGDKGVGKTTLLKKVSNTLEKFENLKIIYTKVPSKTITEEGMNQFIANILGWDSQNGEFNIYEYDKTIENKIVIVMDESQNVFLSHSGGFQAYYALINLINLNTNNIFWVMSFNKYSWLYLNRAFGRTQFFRNVFELTGWSDVKIKELIMKRHAKTKFRLSYDLLINATRSQDEIDKYASVESKFFKLLWELSRGNPRSALYLWISALSRKNKSVFNVNIPKEIDFHGVEKMPDELMFVLAHVIKHENLTSFEIESTTNLQNGYVRNAIKLGLEKKYLYRDERRRYMIDISTQYTLLKLLKEKNFIYGN
jgi:DNA polymerase III delta prime subunit